MLEKYFNFFQMTLLPCGSYFFLEIYYFRNGYFLGGHMSKMEKLKSFFWFFLDDS